MHPTNPEYTPTKTHLMDWVQFTIEELTGKPIADNREQQAMMAYCCKVVGVPKPMIYKRLGLTFQRMARMLEKHGPSFNIPPNAWVIAVVTDKESGVLEVDSTKQHVGTLIEVY